METAINLPLAQGAAPVWREYNGVWAQIHAPNGSYAARKAPTILHRADRAAEALFKLLDMPAPYAQPLDIFLLDPVSDGATDISVQNSASITAVVSPESPGTTVVETLIGRLLTQHLGAHLSETPLFTKGIASLVLDRIGIGSPSKTADAAVRAALVANKQVSIFAPANDLSGADAALYNDVCQSFVAFLLSNSGAATLRKFLTTFDPQRRDQAALAVYQRPLGGLEEAWRAGLRKPAAQKSPFRPFLRHLGPLLRPYWGRELEGFAYVLIGMTYNVVFPLAGKWLIDTIIPQGQISDLVAFSVLLFSIYVLNAVVGMRRSYVNSLVEQSVLADLREKVFSRLQRLSHNFYSEAKVGDIMSRLSNDLQLVQQAISQVTGTGLSMTLNGITAAVVLIALSPLLGGLVLLVIPLLLVSYKILGPRFQTASRTRQKAGGEVNTIAQENISAQSVIKAFGLESQAISSYRQRLNKLVQSAVSLTVLGSIFQTSVTLAITLGQLVVLGIGGYLAMQGQLSVGTLLAAFGLLPSLFFPVSSLASVAETVQSATGAMDRITELLDEPIAVDQAQDATALAPLSKDIELENITFSYNNGSPILRDLNLTIPAGRHTAIVGPSGSGKSTIVNMLIRFWDPQQGRVLFDGADLRQATIDSLRGQIGIVFQDTFIFDTTLRENIAIGRPGATDAEIATAAEAARLSEYINGLPAGYDTVLGERGVRMSGGQRQRLAIARTLLRDPRLLILDEATSALDAQTERGILDTLAAVTKGRTTISITHRLSLAAAADWIVVLEGGAVIEQGAHAELVHAGGLYQRLYEEQMSHTLVGAPSRLEIEAGRLHMIPLFAALPAPTLTTLARQLITERYSAGEDIVRMGDTGDKLYIINKGEVEVLIGKDDLTRRVNTLAEGDYFGEMALLTEEPRNATVRAMMSTEVYSLEQRDLKDLLQGEPAMALALAATMATRRQALVKIKKQDQVANKAPVGR